MHQKTKAAGAASILFTSPWFLLVFLVIPAITVASHFLHFPFSPSLLLDNNIALMVVMALRFVRYLVMAGRTLRYDVHVGRPRQGSAPEAGVEEMRGRLAAAGFRFNASGTYGEMRDHGYYGTILIYGALLLVLVTGSWDNLSQFTGLIRMSSGIPVALDTAKYVDFSRGPYAPQAELPALQVKQQILPDAKWPKGAAEIELLSYEGKTLTQGIISPDRPLSYDGFRYIMDRFFYETVFVIRSTRNNLVYRGYVTLFPVREQKDGFTYHGLLDDPSYPDIRGEAWFNPASDTLKVTASRDGKPILDTRLRFRIEGEITQGEYIALFDGVAKWTTIRVIHDRHPGILKGGGVIVLLGILLRLLFRAQRVWQEEEQGRCRVWAVGKEAKNLMRDEG